MFHLRLECCREFFLVYFRILSRPGVSMVKLMMIVLGLAVLLAVNSLVNCQDQYCEYNLDQIKKNLNSSRNVNSFTVNCVAARDATHAEAISISVFYNQSGSGDVRYDFQCVGGTTLVPTPSSNVSTTFNHACTSCNFASDKPCVESEYIIV